MVDYFNKRALESGFPGIYIIGMEQDVSDGLDAVCIRQPYCAVQEYQKRYGENKRLLKVYPYETICEIETEIKVKNMKCYFSSVVDFDSTPRMGEKAILLQGASPEIFQKSLKKMYQKSIMFGNEFLFINAWNEWGEGMYLEPDQRNGYGYLEAVCNVVEDWKRTKILGEECVVEHIYETEEDKKKHIPEETMRNLQRHDRLLENWMHLRDHKIQFSSYLKKYEYKKIAVYGMGRLGAHLLHELNEEDIQVCFGIDQNYQEDNCAIEVFTPFQQMPEVDAVVVTVLGEYHGIIGVLRQHMSCPIITLEEIVQELLYEC